MMRSIFTLAIAVLAFQASAQKMNEDKVPLTVREAFRSKFPDAKVISWEMEKADCYEAEFKRNKTEHSARFDKAGNWILTETEIPESTLPEQVSAAVKKQYPGYKVQESSQVEHIKHGTCYEVEVKKGKDSFDLLLKPDGSLIEKESGEDDGEDD